MSDKDWDRVTSREKTKESTWLDCIVLFCIFLLLLVLSYGLYRFFK